MLLRVGQGHEAQVAMASGQNPFELVCVDFWTTFVFTERLQNPKVSPFIHSEQFRLIFGILHMNVIVDV